jgi:hypothetical protein
MQSLSEAAESAHSDITVMRAAAYSAPAATAAAERALGASSNGRAHPVCDVTDRNNDNYDQGVFCALAAGTICPRGRAIRGLSRPPPECRAGSKAWHTPSTRAHAIITRRLGPCTREKRRHADSGWSRAARGMTGHLALRKVARWASASAAPLRIALRVFWIAGFLAVFFLFSGAL